MCLLDLGLLIAFIAADPMSGAYMAGLIAVCIPVGILLHHRREAARIAAPATFRGAGSPPDI